ncbi:MAG: carboxypeptidase regulatory-like domain-containing protein, partial [Thermoplasmata archaeon]
MGERMVSPFTRGFLKRRKIVVKLWLVSIILLSTFSVLDWSAAAQSENVFVDGYVIDSKSGLPIAYASIILQNIYNGRTNSTTTDAAGYYNVSIYTDFGGSDFFISAFHDDYLVNSTGIRLEPWSNQTVNILLDRATEKGSYVHGTIYDAVTRVPLPFLGVAAISNNYINISSSNATGYYWMTLQANETYVMQVQKDGYETNRKFIDIKWGENLTVDFPMEPINCTLSGYVKNASGPVGSASVQVYRLDDFGSIEYNPSVNLTTGYFELNLTRGVWQAAVQEGNHFRQTLTVLMTNSQVTWQNFSLSKLPASSATVQGYVKYYDNGTTVGNTQIFAENQNRTWFGIDTTDNTGWYDFQVIPGELTFSIWSQGYESSRVTVNVAEGSTYPLNLTIIDPKLSSFLDGYVKLNGTGEPDVRVVANFGWRLYEDQTDLSGYYNISVPAAPLKVQALKDGFKTAFLRANTTAFETTELNITISHLDWSSEVRGYINDLLGEPVSGGYMSFDYDGFGWESSTAVTDYTGFYQRMVPTGSSSYYAIADDHEYATGVVELPSDGLFWQNESIKKVSYDAKIIVRFTDIYSGQPIARTRISLSEQDMQWSEDAETDAKGWFRADVPAGFVRISTDAWSNGFKYPGMSDDPNRMQFRLKPGETRWLNISLYPREKRTLLHGFVNDTGGIPIQGATVYVEYGDTIVTNKTDGAGYYEFRLPGDHEIDAWVRAPEFRMVEYTTRVEPREDVWYDWVLDDSDAWFE